MSFNEGIHAFIKLYGSREKAGQVLGYNGKMLGQLLREEWKVPLLTALRIELLSNGRIPVDRLLQHSEPQLSKLYADVRQLHYKRARDSAYQAKKAPVT